MGAVVSGAAANIISEVCKCVIDPLVQLIKDVIHLDRNTRLLQEKLIAARAFKEETANRFQHQQRRMPADVNEGLEKLHESLEDAERVINRSQQRQGCLDRSFCKPRQIRKCYMDIEERYNHLQSVISTGRETQEIASSAQLQAGAVLQPVPASGYVGSGIISDEEQLNKWLEDAEDRQFRVIGVFGMGGIGKTSLLKKVYNSHKKGNVFEVVIWLIISQKVSIPDLQSIIAKEINLDLGSSSSNAESSSAVLDMRKTRLYNYLKEKKFLLVLDDVWKPIQLEEELGIPLGNDKGSKVVISTRRRDVIREMGADDSYCIQIRPLSRDEGWLLFCSKAFKTSAAKAPTKRIEDVAIQIAEECKGLPLAINVVAAAMIGNINADEWDLALSQMKSVDPHFGTMFSEAIDEGLYKKLQWSYDLLPDYLKNCFLYCGAFSEDAEIEVERLVEMWIGEGMVNSRDKRQLMDVGRRYVKQLVERCLFEYVREMEFIKVHDILRDMALYIAEKEGKCLFRTSQKLDEFPAEQVMDDCKRIAIRYYNDTAFLPTDLRCLTLRTLILAQNEGLREVPNGFLLNLTSLRVLDLSDTSITSLPDSMWQLKQLEFVRLNGTKISSLPAEICNLSRLQFLHLSGCTELESLPCAIKELKNLKNLDLSDCDRLAGIPGEICQLTSLNKLDLDGCDRLAGIPGEICQLTSLNKLNLYSWPEAKLGVDEAKNGMCSLKDFTNFPNLMELSVRVKQGNKVDGIRSGIRSGIMGTWLELKHLVLCFDHQYEHDVMEDLPPDMQNMKNLHSFDLRCYGGISLPNCICDFQRLEVLSLLSCYKLKELPPLERLPVLRVLALYNLSEVRELGIRGSVGGFPMLERLTISMMDSLESISNVVWTEATLPKLQSVSIWLCRALKRLPIGIEKLSNLKDIEIDQDVWERSIAADKNIKICLEKRVRIR